ncbi:MAG TPA: CoA pyrophosphatase [Bacteroidales bacterium]|nr:CoA pyrophosphatase [Bacteroidales bacterium]
MINSLGEERASHGNHFQESLRSSIARGLPGSEVQWKMASSDRFLKDFPRNPGKDAREAAVLVILFPEQGSVHTLLMKRPDYTGHHGGQISFPGGKMEPSDEDLVKTAVREAFEETGCKAENSGIIGSLTPLFIPVSNMLVTALICWFNELPELHPDSHEVEYLITVDLTKLLDPSAVRFKPMEIRGETYDVRYFSYEGHVIWGATAMILNELLEIIKRDSIPLHL